MRGRRRGAVVGALGVVLALGAVGPVQAAETGRAGSDRARWLMDERTGRVTDSSGRGNHGTAYDVDRDGRVYRFNGSSSRVVVPDAASLDPGAAGFTFGAVLTLAGRPDTGETYDVLRKGLARTSGGHYKLEVKRVRGVAVARCVVKDSSRVTVAVQTPATSAYDLGDGDVHRVTCRKTDSGVTVTVDGLRPRTKSVTRLRSVGNDADLALGAKAEEVARTGFDWFRGTMREAWVSGA